MKDAHGKLTNTPDLSIICREEMMPVDLQIPPPWVEMNETGRDLVSRATRNSFLALAKDDPRSAGVQERNRRFCWLFLTPRLKPLLRSLE